MFGKNIQDVTSFFVEGLCALNTYLLCTFSAKGFTRGSWLLEIRHVSNPMLRSLSKRQIALSSAGAPCGTSVLSMSNTSPRQPSTKNYIKAMELMQTDRGNTVFIGDQLFTDVWGAKRTGMKSILVKPINPKEEIQIVLKRYLEKIVLHFYKKENEKRMSCK